MKKKILNFELLMTVYPLILCYLRRINYSNMKENCQEDFWYFWYNKNDSFWPAGESSYLLVPIINPPFTNKQPATNCVQKLCTIQ